MKFKVIVTPKKAVLDPQGNAVRDAMRHLGMPQVQSVRIGKYMEIELAGKDVDLEKRLHDLCRDLLSNPVIEDYDLRRDGANGRAMAGRGHRARRAGLATPAASDWPEAPQPSTKHKSKSKSKSSSKSKAKG